MSLYAFAYEQFRGRSDVQNIYSLKPKNVLEPYSSDTSSVKEVLLTVCNLKGMLHTDFNDAFIDAFEDDEFEEYTCVEVSINSPVPDSQACSRAKSIVNDFETVFLALTAQSEECDKYLYENKLLKLYRDAVAVLETSNDFATSVILEDFIESNREFISGVVSKRKNKSKRVVGIS